MTRRHNNEPGEQPARTAKHCPHCGSAPAERKHAFVATLVLMTALISIGGTAWAVVRSAQSSPAPVPVATPQPTPVPAPRLTLGDLLTMPASEIGKVDVAEMNLLCAQSLPGAEGLDVAQCLRTVDEWAGLTGRMTDERIGIFRQNPEQFNNSENWWRVGALVGVLNRVIGTSYNPALKNAGALGMFDTTPFQNARDIFIHGLLTANRQGTCSSMPVLVTAVGRRLGYPLKLVAGRNHLFVRWDDGNERFNIEVTDSFAESKPDDFYHEWPRPNRLPLKSMTPAEELSTFLAFRGLCLMQHKRWRDAEVAFAHAHAIVPDSTANMPYLEHLLAQERYGPMAIFMQPPR